MDLFVVPTIGFDLLYALVIVRLARRDLVWINVTAHPTADWIACQITEAFPWAEAPRYLIRDRPRLALAEGLCRKADRIDPTRVRRPCGCLGRSACRPGSPRPAPSPDVADRRTTGTGESRNPGMLPFWLPGKRGVSESPVEWAQLAPRSQRGMCDELAAIAHSITSSASSRNASGIDSPNALAALRLTRSANVVGCTTGNSAGFSPRKMRAI